MFVTQGFVGLAAFVGFGLEFAAVADSCAMVFLLARMPSNQANIDGCRTCPAERVPAQE